MADPDMLLQLLAKPGGFKYYDYVLVYVDDILCISHKPRKVMEQISAKTPLSWNPEGAY